MTQQTLFLILPALLPAFQLLFGSPACSGPDRTLEDRRYYVACYDAGRKLSAWVSYHLDAQHLIPLAARPSGFRRDSQLASGAATNLDYKGSGFDRAHYAPARDFSWDDDAIRSTFSLINAAPLRPNVNRGRLAQLEAAVRRLASEFDSLTVITGVLFDDTDPQFIGSGRVAVPAQVFKVILAIRGSSKVMFAYLVPNRVSIAEPVSHFATTVDEVERLTNLDFFSELEDSEECALESQRRVLDP